MMGWAVWPPFPGVGCILHCIFFRTKGYLLSFASTQNSSVVSVLQPFHTVLLPSSILKVKLNGVVYAKFSVENLEEGVLGSSANNN